MSLYKVMAFQQSILAIWFCSRIDLLYLTVYTRGNKKVYFYTTAYIFNIKFKVIY